MTPTLAFQRILIDLDITGGPIGLAVEVWEDGTRTRLTVLERPGPFDTPLECLVRAVLFVEGQYGRQVNLF